MLIMIYNVFLILPRERNLLLYRDMLVATCSLQWQVFWLTAPSEAFPDCRWVSSGNVSVGKKAAYSSGTVRDLHPVPCQDQNEGNALYLRWLGIVLIPSSASLALDVKNHLRCKVSVFLIELPKENLKTSPQKIFVIRCTLQKKW